MKVKFNVMDCVDTRRLTPLNYNKTKDEFSAKGIRIPEYKDLGITYDSEMNILLNPVTIKVTGDINITYEFKAGYCWDFCSIPKIARGMLIDNDSAYGIVASLLHDQSFSSGCVSFHKANELFRLLLIDQGCKWFKARLMWLGVSSPVGKYYYEHGAKDRKFHEQFCVVTK